MSANKELKQQQQTGAKTQLAMLLLLALGCLWAIEGAGAVAVNIWKHRYPFYGGYYPGYGGYGYHGYGGIGIGGFGLGGYGR